MTPPFDLAASARFVGAPLVVVAALALTSGAGCSASSKVGGRGPADGNSDASRGGPTGAGGSTGDGGGSTGDGGGSTGDGGGPSTAGCTRCTAYGAPGAPLAIAGGELANLSGAAFSWKNPGILFAHNDASEAVVYALSEEGAVVGRYALLDANAVDMEDMGVGPCADGTCLYLADFGGNRSPRTEYSIYRTPEPAVGAGAGATDAAVPVAFERFRFAYDDGALHNAESLLVEPATGALYVITKVPAGQPSVAYRLPHPLDASVVNRADRVATLPVPGPGNREATSSSAHPCGAGFLLRTYDALYEFRTAPGTPLEEAFGVAPALVPAPSETQSEAVSYRPDGRGYATSGEGATLVHEVSCE